MKDRNRRRTRQAVLAGAFLLAGIHAAGADTLSAPTVGAFLAACQSDKGGCSSAVGSVLLMGPLDDSICLPDSGSDYTLPVVDWLKAHPETAAMKTHDGILEALKTVYRC